MEKTRRFIEIMQKVGDALKKGCDERLDDNSKYELIAECNALSGEIDDEIVIIQDFIRGKYGHKLPILMYFEDHPVDYARVVKKIGNKTSLSVVDLEGLDLPSMVVEEIIYTIDRIRLCSTSIREMLLSEDDMLETCRACDRAIELDNARKKVYDYIQGRMVHKFAPNLSALVGSVIATKYVCSAGSLRALANMRPCQVLLLGSNNMVLHRVTGTFRCKFRSVYFVRAEMFKNKSNGLKMRASSLLAEKCVIAARVDFERGDPSGETGRTFYNEMIEKIKELEESDPSLVDSVRQFNKPVMGICDVNEDERLISEIDVVEIWNRFSKLYGCRAPCQLDF